MEGDAKRLISRSDAPRLGDSGQLAIQIDQERGVVLANGQGHVPTLSGDEAGHQTQRLSECGVLVQIPRREVGVDQGGVEPVLLNPSSSASRLGNRFTW